MECLLVPLCFMVLGKRHRVHEIVHDAFFYKILLIFLSKRMF